MPRQDQPKEIEFFEEGMVRATIWESPSGMNAGLTVTVGRRVWDPQLAEWWTSGNLRLDDLFPAAVTLAMAQERIVEIRAERRSSSLFENQRRTVLTKPATASPGSKALLKNKRDTSR